MIYPEQDRIVDRLKETELWLELSQSRVRTLIETIPAGLFILNKNGEILGANPPSLQLMNCRYDELNGLRIHDLLKTDDIASPIPAPFVDCQWQSEIIRQDKSRFYARMTLRSFSRNDEWLLFVQDISAEKELERVKREFTAMLAHDIRTPLSSVVGIVQLLNEGLLGTLNDKGKQITASVKVTCNQIMGLLNDLLDLEKIAAGKFVLERESLSAVSLLEEARTIVDNLAAERALRIKIEGDERCRCYGDRQRLLQVLTNLLSNAVKYADMNTEILVKVERLNSSALFSVEDRGRGIPADRLASVFASYEQVQSSDWKKSKGVGLGLAVCKAVVQAHGGQICVESDFGIGSKFWFEIPDS